MLEQRQSIGPLDAVGTCLSRYAAFRGRARRGEFWWFFAFVVLGTVVFLALDALVFGLDEDDLVTTPLTILFQVATLVPLLAAGWRRMQDTGRPGWLVALPLIVLVVVEVLDALAGLAALGATSASTGDDGSPLPSSPVTTAIAIVGGLAQIGSTALVLFWLTRPSEELPNDYGLVPE